MPRPRSHTTPTADRLRDLRAEAGLSQQQLAEEAGLSRTTIASWEIGAAEPGLGHAALVARALAVHLPLTAEQVLARMGGV